MPSIACGRRRWRDGSLAVHAFLIIAHTRGGDSGSSRGCTPSEASAAATEYLANVKKALETGKKT